MRQVGAPRQQKTIEKSCEWQRKHDFFPRGLRPRSLVVSPACQSHDIYSCSQLSLVPRLRLRKCVVVWARSVLLLTLTLKDILAIWRSSRQKLWPQAASLLVVQISLMILVLRYSAPALEHAGREHTRELARMLLEFRKAPNHKKS